MKNASTPAAIALLVVAAALAQGTTPIVYPAKGQSQEQQAKDKSECDAWAKSSTGIDPAAVEEAENQAQADAQQAQQQAEAAKQEKLQTYGRAVAACLEGRGYTVK
jgi:hypothetical protein